MVKTVSENDDGLNLENVNTDTFESSNLPPEDDWEQADFIRTTMRSYLNNFLTTLSKLKNCIIDFDQQFSPSNINIDNFQASDNPMLIDQ